MALLEPLVDVVRVQSTNLVSYGYDPARKVLAVWFISGELFHHHDVPAVLWTAFQNAPSKGKFYGVAVRGKFNGLKMSGHCPKCGALGLVGLVCEDCGCADVVPDPPKPKRAKKTSAADMGGAEADPPALARPVEDWTDRR